MSQKVSELINQAQIIQEPIWNTISSVFSEAAGGFFVSKDLTAAAVQPDDLTEYTRNPHIVITFSLAHLADRMHVLLIKEGDFAALLTALNGVTTTSVTEPVLTENRGMLESLVQGLCLGVGNLRGEAAAAVALTIRIQSLDLPDNLANGTVIKANAALAFDATRMDIVWLYDPISLDALTPQQKTSNSFGGRASSHEVGASGPANEDASLQLLLDIPLGISVELGRVKMVVRDVLELGAGSIVEIDKAAGEPVDVLVNGKHVARGEVVVIEDNFGVRITEILNPQERLAKLNEAA